MTRPIKEIRSPSITVDELRELEKAGELDRCIIYDLPISVYHDDQCPGIQASMVCGVGKSYHDYMSKRAERAHYGDGRDFIFGNAVHTAVLEPATFDSRYTVAPPEPECDKRTKEGKKIYKHWVETVMGPWSKEHGHKIVLKQEELDDVRVMARRCFEHPKFHTLLSSGQTEVSYFSRCQKTGLLKKCRADLISPSAKIICDLKTTSDASANGFARSVVKFLYHVKAAYYWDILKEIYGEEFVFTFMAAEKAPSYDVQMHELLNVHIQLGQMIYQPKLEYIAKVLRGELTGMYPHDINAITLPKWAFDLDNY